MQKIENYIIDTINKYDLMDGLLLVGVSGGPDSIALTYLLKKLGVDIHIVHLNHCLRNEESDADEEFVRNIAQSLRIPYTIEKRVVKKEGSLQQSARKVRYDFFLEVYEKVNAKAIVLAQHKDDQVETILMNFFRGAGLTGLSGIKELSVIRGMKILRPLLKLGKGEILDYLQQNSIQYRIDSSNVKDKYQRNKFRLNIIPFLEGELGNGFKDSILNNMEVFKSEEEYFIEESKTILARLDRSQDHPQYDIVIDTELGSYHKAIISWVIRLALAEKYNLRNFTSKHIMDIVNACKANKATSIDLPHNIVFRRWGNNLAFKIKELKVKTIPGRVEVPLDTMTSTFNDKIIISSKYIEGFKHMINGDNLEFPLYIRSRKKGDTIKLSPKGGTKKLKDLMIDLKIDKDQRDSIPLLVDKNDNIVCIIGYRVSGDYYVNSNTNEKLYIYIS